jgi:hypothetical protein
MRRRRWLTIDLALIFQPGVLSHPDHAMHPKEHGLSREVLEFLIEHQDNFLIGMQLVSHLYQLKCFRWADFRNLNEERERTRLSLSDLPIPTNLARPTNPPTHPSSPSPNPSPRNLNSLESRPIRTTSSLRTLTMKPLPEVTTLSKAKNIRNQQRVHHPSLRHRLHGQSRLFLSSLLSFVRNMFALHQRRFLRIWHYRIQMMSLHQVVIRSKKVLGRATGINY